MEQAQPVTEQKPKIGSLLELIAVGSTSGARDLLKKYGKTDAKNHADLQIKLADLYKNYPDKIEIEKEFIKLHPHKDFILKYSGAPVESIEPIEFMALQDKSTKSSHETKSNCEGCGGKCGQSMFDGTGAPKQEIQQSSPIAVHNNTNLIIGTVAIVALFGLLLHYKPKL